jgi:cytochrome c553
VFDWSFGHKTLARLLSKPIKYRRLHKDGNRVVGINYRGNSIMRVIFILLLLCMSPWRVVLAADIQAGQTLHNAHCIACHDALTEGNPEGIYTRPDRQVTSYPALLEQVRRCQMSLGLTWSDDTLNDVAAFLNNRYYKF